MTTNSTIKLWIEDVITGEVLEELGSCLTDSPNRAVQMYDEYLDRWVESGYAADIVWAYTDELVYLVNQWSGASGSHTMTWEQIKRWGSEHIHHTDLRQWLKTAKSAYNKRDGDTLGSMILGS